MGKLRKELGIELNPIRVIESALGKVGNIFEGAVGIVTSGIKSIGNTVDKILKDPLPTIIQVVGAMNGIPPYVTSAAITAAKGGKLEDIAKSAAISYATSTFMQNTNIGQAIGQTAKDLGSDFTVGLIEKFDLPMDTAVMVSRAATASLNSAFIGGVSAAISGQSISKGLTSGFTSGLLYSTTDSFFDALNKDPNWGFSPTALNLIKGAANTALSTIVSGKGDPAAAVGNYVAYATLKMGASSLYDSVAKAYNDFTGKTEEAQKAQDSYTTLKAQYDAEVARYNKTIADLKVNEETYKNVYNQQYLPIKNQLDSYENTAKSYEYFFNSRKQDVENVRWRYENWDEFAANNSSMVDSGYTRESALAQAQGLVAEANGYANSANEYAAKHSDLLNSGSTQAVINSLRTTEINMNANVSTLTSIQSNIETPANGNLAEQLKNAAEKYQKDYSSYASSKEAAERAAQNYNQIIAEIAARDATIDAVNSGAIDVVKDFGNGSYSLSNGLVLQDGKFYQDGLPAFTNAAGISQSELEFKAPSGKLVKYGTDSGRQLTVDDVQNIFTRDYGVTISAAEASQFAGAPYKLYDNGKFKAYAYAEPIKQAAQEEGVSLTPEQVENFAKNSTTLAGAVDAVRTYADPRYTTVNEAQQALIDAGFSTEDAQKLAPSASGSGVGNVEKVVTSNRPLLEDSAKKKLIASGFDAETAELLAPKAAGPVENILEVLKNREQLVPLTMTAAEDVDGTKVGTLSTKAKEYSDKLFEQLQEIWPDASDGKIKSVAEVVSSDLYDWYHSMGRPIDVENPTQFSRGMAMANTMLGVTDNMVALQTGANNISHAKKNLERFDLIDQGKAGDVLQERGISDYTRFKINQYITGDEETRDSIRREELGGIDRENSNIRQNMLKVFEAYSEARKYQPGAERDELNPYVPPSSVEDFTDIETAQQFGSWLAYNMGSGLVQFAPILAAGLTTGGAGVLAMGTAFGLQEAIGERIRQIGKETPNWSSLSSDKQAELIISKLQDSAGTNILVGMGVGALDRVLGPAASAVKNSLFKIAAKDMVSSGAISALKDMPKEAAEEFVAGNLQQLAQILGSRHLGEQTGDLFSVDNLKAMFNAGMAELAGSLGASGANVFISGGLQQFGEDAINRAADKISRQIAEQDLPQTELIRPPVVHVDTAGNKYFDTDDGLVIVENQAGNISLLDANTGQAVAISDDDRLALINRYVEPYATLDPVEAPRAADQILSTIDARVVNEAEVRQMFYDLGYAPSDAEVAQYVNARYDASGAPNADLVGKPMTQQDIQNTVTAYADPKAVDKEEAKAALKEAGVTNPTQDEIDKLIGKYPESELQDKAQQVVERLPFDKLAAEVAAIQSKIGAPNTLPTLEDAMRANRIAVGMEPGVGRKQGDPGFDKNYDVTGDGRVTAADALKLAKMAKGMEFGTLPPGLKWEQPTGLYKRMLDVENAIQNIDFPDTLSEQDVRGIVDAAFKNNPGLTEADVSRVVNEALDLLPAAPTKQDVLDAVNEGIGSRSVKDDPNTPANEAKEATGIYREIEAIERAIAGIEIPPSLTEQQVRDIVSGVLKENPGLSSDDVKGIVNTALEQVPAAPTIEEITAAVDGVVGAPSVKDDPATPENEARDATGVYRSIEATAAGLETRLGAAIDAAKAAGLAGDAALDAAIKNVAAQIGVSEETILGKIGKTAEDLSTDFAEQLKPIKEQLTSIEQAVGKPEAVDAQGNKTPATGLYADIAKNEAAGMTREAATQKAITDLSTKLGTSEQALKDALAATESTLGGRITTVEQAIGAPESVDKNGNKIAATGLYADIAKNEAAGMSREAATQKAIADLSTKLGESEIAIKAALTASETALGGRITTVEQAIGAPESVDAQGNKIAATGLYAEIAKNEAAGMTREAATQKAIADLSKQLGASETAIKNALATAESTLGGRITTVEQAIGAPASVDANGNPIAATGIFAEIAKNEAAGMTREAATQKAIADLSTKLGASEAAIKTALAATESTLGGRITTVEQAIGTPASVGADGKPIAATGLFAEIAKNEAAGMTRDAATQKAITDLSKQLGASETAIKAALTATETTLGGRITTVEQAVGAPASIGADGKPVAATGLFAEIAKNEAAGMSRDAATQKAITDLSTQLGVTQQAILGEMAKTEARFGTALTGAQTALSGQITDAQNKIMERMAIYEQAGIDRDTALNLAIEDVSTKLGGQIAGVQQLVGKPATVATQTDIDAINQMLSGALPMDLSYDITGDKVVDPKDIEALQRWLNQPAEGGLSKRPEDITLPGESRWAPTGLYGELAKAETDRLRIATQQAQQAQRAQQSNNLMQMLNLIGQDPTAGGQQVTVKAPDPAKIGYIYDWGSIFANPQQQQMFASPFAEGGEVADTDELIAILRGSHE